jgi:hypothetical protein
MASDKPQRRKSADGPLRKTVKTSLIIDVNLHIKLSAYAAMRGMDRNAIVVEILADALGSIVCFDRRDQRAKSPAPVDSASGVDREDAA